MQTVVVDPEVMRDLVDHRDRHLLDHIGLAIADLQQTLRIDRDGIRQGSGVGRVTIGQRDAFVETE